MSQISEYLSIHVTDERCNFVAEDCFALNCNLSSLLVFPNERNAWWELKIVYILTLLVLSIPKHGCSDGWKVPGSIPTWIQLELCFKIYGVFVSYICDQRLSSESEPALKRNSRAARRRRHITAHTVLTQEAITEEVGQLK